MNPTSESLPTDTKTETITVVRDIEISYETPAGRANAIRIATHGGYGVGAGPDCGRYAARFAGHGQETGWISVTDRLPDDEREVLVIECGQPTIGAYTKAAYSRSKKRAWETGTCGYCHSRGDGGITHWMPIPKLPAASDPA